jgi:hypothetical protein
MVCSSSDRPSAGIGSATSGTPRRPRGLNFGRQAEPENPPACSHSEIDDFMTVPRSRPG